VAFPGGAAEGVPSTEPTTGFFLLSFFVDDVDGILGRLAAADLGGAPRRIEVPGPTGPVTMVTVRDPDGVVIELIAR
jgi:catechol 2,3-dioxygenase-like lactoylglutathione lyase family enzyme